MTISRVQISGVGPIIVRERQYFMTWVREQAVMSLKTRDPVDLSHLSTSARDSEFKTPLANDYSNHREFIKIFLNRGR